MTQVTIAGVSGETTVEVGAEGLPVSEVLKTAAENLGFTGVDFESLAPVVNGEDVDSETVVHENDVLTAAPLVKNGGSTSLLDKGIGAQ
jgi:hypothetical protein